MIFYEKLHIDTYKNFISEHKINCYIIHVTNNMETEILLKITLNDLINKYFIVVRIHYIVSQAVKIRNRRSRSTGHLLVAMST